jgi:uncharacterized phage protein (TIGR02218 family)
MSPTYDELESSRDSGAPVELLELSHGASFWRFTSSDQPYTYSAHTYQPEPGLARSAIEHSQEAVADEVKVQLELANPVSQLLLADGAIDPVYVTIYRFHRGAPSDVVSAFIGEVVEFHFGPEGAELTCAPLTAAFERRVPTTLCSRQCQKTTYSADCGVNKADFKTTAVLSAVSGNVVQSTTFDTPPDQYFRGGWIQRASGERRFIVDHVGAALTLTHPIPGLAPGETVDAYAGDDHQEATCRDKFSNLVNFLGFPDIPTRNPYKGSIT